MNTTKKVIITMSLLVGILFTTTVYGQQPSPNVHETSMFELSYALMEAMGTKQFYKAYKYIDPSSFYNEKINFHAWEYIEHKSGKYLYPISYEVSTDKDPQVVMKCLFKKSYAKGFDLRTFTFKFAPHLEMITDISVGD